jgi:superfamily II DNA or RNA helicase
LVDEAHRAVAEGYRRVIDHFAPAKLLGCTATADRLDGTSLGEVFECAPFTYDVRKALADGWLAPIVQRRVQVASLDLSRVHTLAGDLSAAELEEQMLQAAVLAEVAGPLVELAGERRTIVFTAGVAQAHALAEVICGLGRKAAALDGSTSRDRRQQLLQQFDAGEIQFMSNVGVLTEGFDSPEVGCVAVARPTKSRALYTQMIGRGMRLAPGKPDCLVLDFVGNSGRHKLVNSLDVLSGSDVDPYLRGAAERLMERDPELAAHDALEQAVALAAERAKRVQYSTLVVDPFAIVALGLEWRDVNVVGERASERQVETLKTAGIKAEWHRLTKYAASSMIDALAKRRGRGLCTLKQAAQLGNRGLNPDVSFDDARRALDAIAANRWRTPAWLLRDPRYVPAGAP